MKSIVFHLALSLCLQRRRVNKGSWLSRCSFQLQFVWLHLGEQQWCSVVMRERERDDGEYKCLSNLALACKGSEIQMPTMKILCMCAVRWKSMNMRMNENTSLVSSKACTEARAETDGWTNKQRNIGRHRRSTAKYTEQLLYPLFSWKQIDCLLFCQF